MHRLTAKLHDHVVVTFVESYMGLRILQSINGLPVVLRQTVKTHIEPWQQCIVRVIAVGEEQYGVEIVSQMGTDRSSLLLVNVLQMLRRQRSVSDKQTATGQALAIALANIEMPRIDEFLLDLLAVHSTLEDRDSYRLDYFMVCSAIERVLEECFKAEVYHSCKTYLDMARHCSTQEEHYGLARHLVEKALAIAESDAPEHVMEALEGLDTLNGKCGPFFADRSVKLRLLKLREKERVCFTTRFEIAEALLCPPQVYFTHTIDTDAVRQLLEPLIALNSEEHKGTVSRLMALVCIHDGNDAKALPWIEQATGIDDYATERLFAETYMKVGKPELAAPWFERCLRSREAGIADLWS